MYEYEKKHTRFLTDDFFNSLNYLLKLSNYIYIYTTCESTFDTLCTHQPLTRCDNTISVAQGGTATTGATKQILPPYRVFIFIIYFFPWDSQFYEEDTLL